MTPIEHQNLLKANIQAAVGKGDHARANVLRAAYKPLLEINLTPRPPRGFLTIGALLAWKADSKGKP